MGVEGKDRAKVLEAGAALLSNQLGRRCSGCARVTDCRCRPLAAVWRRQVDHLANRAQRDQPNADHNLAARPCARRVDRIDAAGRRGSPFIEHLRRGTTPIFVSDHGLCRLAVIGWLKTVDWLTGTIFRPTRRRARIHCRPSRLGRVSVGVGRRARGRGRGSSTRVCAGETLRDRCDMPHRIRNMSEKPAHATMVCILKAAMMDRGGAGRLDLGMSRHGRGSAPLSSWINALGAMTSIARRVRRTGLAFRAPN